MKPQDLLNLFIYLFLRNDYRDHLSASDTATATARQLVPTLGRRSKGCSKAIWLPQDLDNFCKGGKLYKNPVFCEKMKSHATAAPPGCLQGHNADRGSTVGRRRMCPQAPAAPAKKAPSLSRRLADSRLTRIVFSSSMPTYAIFLHRATLLVSEERRPYWSND